MQMFLKITKHMNTRLVDQYELHHTGSHKPLKNAFSGYLMVSLKWPTLASQWLHQNVVMLHSIMNWSNFYKFLSWFTLHDLIHLLYKLDLLQLMHLDIPFLWTYRLYGTQFHMKFCHHHWTPSDHGSNINIYLAGILIIIIVCHSICL